MRARRISYLLANALAICVGIIVTLVAVKPEKLLDTLGIAVGSSLIATGIVGWTMWVYVRQQEKSAASARAVDKAGIQYVYPKRAAQIRQEYDRRLRHAKRVDIMGFGLRQFNLDYMRKLGDLSKHAKFRILIINPSSAHAAARDAEEKQSPDTIKREADEFIAQFAALYSKNTSKLQLRVYDCLPMVNIFRIDGDIFWGPYLLDRNSGNTFTVRARRRGVVYSQLKAHFDSAWETAHVPTALGPTPAAPAIVARPGTAGQLEASAATAPAPPES